MTIHGILKSLSAKELALTKRYYESIQRFEVQPSDTYEFDAEFPPKTGSASSRRSRWTKTRR